MDTLFEHDQTAEDEYQEREEDRRQRLIDEAVSKFAPRLASKPGVEVIHLYSTNASLRKYFRDNFSGERTIFVEHCLADGRERKDRHEIQHEGVFITLPDKADLVVTKSNLSSKVEWLGARLGAMVAVLPEAEEYLRARLARQQLLILVGGDQARG
jgi:hypothetical protein